MSSERRAFENDYIRNAALDDAESTIVDAVTRVSAEWSNESLDDQRRRGYVQSALKVVLRDLAIALGYAVPEREWLFDVTWFCGFATPTNAAIGYGVPAVRLACEVEWDAGLARWKDLRKLFLFKAELKVGILTSKRKWEKTVSEFMEESRSGLSGRYLAVNFRSSSDSVSWNVVDKATLDAVPPDWPTVVRGG